MLPMKAYHSPKAMRGLVLTKEQILSLIGGTPVAQWVKRRPTGLAERIRVPLEAKSSQP